MPNDPVIRTRDDLARVVRAIAREFKTDSVFIIGSQAVLMSWPDAPYDMRGTPEIDAYPGNARLWEAEESAKEQGYSPEASEHIHGLFGEGSQFHESHGFYIDGVDEGTAKLPRTWRERAIVRVFDVDGREVKAIAPTIEDVIVSKLARLDEKDTAFAKAYHRERPLDLGLMEQRISEAPLEPAIAERAVAYIRKLIGTS